MSDYINNAKLILKAKAEGLHKSGVTEWPVRAADLNDEFPGLDAISRKVFDVPFSDATPNLREHVRIIAKRDASEKMYDTLRTNITFVPCSCVSVEIHRPQCPRGQFIEAIMEAEGRKVPVVKSGS